MAGSRWKWPRAACLAGAALAIASCSLSTPSPAGGFHHDFTPRTLGPGLMNTRLVVTRTTFIADKLEDAILIGQTFGVGGNSQWDFVAEARTLSITDNDPNTDAPDIEADGYYLGGQYKSPFPKALQETILFSYFAGAGMGAYSDYVKHVDAHAGLAGGYNGKYFCPFLAMSGGVSVPYARKVFSHSNVNILGGNVRLPDRYRYATSAWMGYEAGMESPFGDREKGFRLQWSIGYDFYHMFEDDIVNDRTGSVFHEGVELRYKTGLSWTY